VNDDHHEGVVPELDSGIIVDWFDFSWEKDESFYRGFWLKLLQIYVTYTFGCGLRCLIYSIASGLISEFLLTRDQTLCFQVWVRVLHGRHDFFAVSIISSFLILYSVILQKRIITSVVLVHFEWIDWNNKL